MISDSQIKKINVLNQYKKYKEKYLYYENQLKGVNSIDFNHIKSTVHPTLVDKIHKKDNAYQNMMNNYIKVIHLINKYVPFPNDMIMYDIFIKDLNFDDLERKMNMDIPVIKNIFYYSLDLINLE